jgi:hypothetical protein
METLYYVFRVRFREQYVKACTFVAPSVSSEPPQGISPTFGKWNLDFHVHEG